MRLTRTSDVLSFETLRTQNLKENTERAIREPPLHDRPPQTRHPILSVNNLSAHSKPAVGGANPRYIRIPPGCQAQRGIPCEGDGMRGLLKA